MRGAGKICILIGYGNPADEHEDPNKNKDADRHFTIANGDKYEYLHADEHTDQHPGDGHPGRGDVAVLLHGGIAADRDADGDGGDLEFGVFHRGSFGEHERDGLAGWG